MTPIKEQVRHCSEEEKTVSSVISCGEVTLAGVPSPLHLLVWKSGYILSKLFSTDVSIQVNRV